jgi:hypothetical protein
VPLLAKMPFKPSAVRARHSCLVACLLVRIRTLLGMHAAALCASRSPHTCLGFLHCQWQGLPACPHTCVSASYMQGSTMLRVQVGRPGVYVFA